MAGLSQTRLCAQPTQASVVKADHLRVDMDAPGRFLYYEVDCHRDGWITQLDDQVEELMEKNMERWWPVPSTIARLLQEDPNREAIRIHTQVGLRTGCRRLKLRLMKTCDNTWLYQHEQANLAIIIRYMPAQAVVCSVHATWKEDEGNVQFGWYSMSGTLQGKWTSRDSHTVRIKDLRRVVQKGFGKGALNLKLLASAKGTLMSDNMGSIWLPPKKFRHGAGVVPHRRLTKKTAAGKVVLANHLLPL